MTCQTIVSPAMLLNRLGSQIYNWIARSGRVMPHEPHALHSQTKVEFLNKPPMLLAVRHAFVFVFCDLEPSTEIDSLPSRPADYTSTARNTSTLVRLLKIGMLIGWVNRSFMSGNVLLAAERTVRCWLYTLMKPGLNDWYFVSRSASLQQIVEQ